MHEKNSGEGCDAPGRNIKPCRNPIAIRATLRLARGQATRTRRASLSPRRAPAMQALDVHGLPQPGRHSGKRGRPESLVRQYWQDIDNPAMGPKCIFCDHRSVTRTFRAPPATRHTLICKNAPEDVKEQLRRVTNNKYSRRALEEAGADPTGSAAYSVFKEEHPAGAHAHHGGHSSGGAGQGHGGAHNGAHSGPGGAGAGGHVGNGVASPVVNSGGRLGGASQRHMGNGSVSPMQAMPGAGVDPSRVPGQSMVAGGVSVGVGVGVTGVGVGGGVGMASHHDDSLGGSSAPRADVSGGNLSTAQTNQLSSATDALYAGSTAGHRFMQHHADDMARVSAAGRANAALAAAVIEALFPPEGSRAMGGSVPTPGEFRAALHDVKEVARNKARWRVTQARRQVAALQKAVNMLVSGGRTHGGTDGDSDEEAGDPGVHPAHPNVDGDSRLMWGARAVYPSDRAHK